MKRVLVVGGYGAVGRHAAEHLVGASDTSVAIAGRDRRKADRLARRLGCRAEGTLLDASNLDQLGSAVRASDAVLCCTETSVERVADACIEHGRAFVAVAASIDLLRRLSQRSSAASASGVSAVIGVGLAPGITHLLARRLRPVVNRSSRVWVVVCLSAFDAHGPEALSWVLKQAAAAQGVVSLDLPFGSRTGIPIEFVECEALASELGVARVESYLSLWPDWAAGILPSLAGSLRPTADACAIGLGSIGNVLTTTGVAAGRFTVGVCARSNYRPASAWMTGKDQSRATGIIAAEAVRRVLHGRVQDGVHGFDQVMEISDLEPSLGAIGCRFLLPG